MRFGVFAVVAYIVSMQAAIRGLLRQRRSFPDGTSSPTR